MRSMTLYKIHDPHRFFDEVLACDGEVGFLDSNSVIQDLKATVRTIQDLGMVGFIGPIEQIKVCTELSNDAIRLIRSY